LEKPFPRVWERLRKILTGITGNAESSWTDFLQKTVCRRQTCPKETGSGHPARWARERLLRAAGLEPMHFSDRFKHCAGKIEPLNVQPWAQQAGDPGA